MSSLTPQKPLPLRPAGAPQPRPAGSVLPRPAAPGFRPSAPAPLTEAEV